MLVTSRSCSLLLLLPALAAQDAASRPLVVPRQVYAAQSRFDRPLLVEFHASEPDSAFVVVQPGQVFRVPRADDRKERAVFADLAAAVYSGDNWEEGLLGFCFDPAYAEN